MFEAVCSERINASPEALWELWSDTDRWPDWNDQIQRVEVDGELGVGAEVRTKMRRGGMVRNLVTEYEPGRKLTYEARFPGARSGLEHRLRPGRRSVEVTHRRYVEGPLAGVWAPMLGRKRMREAVERFVQRERELTQSSSGRA
ncbi:MAG: SRPBCC family protein [Solirubrobacterales bacterium]